MPGHITAPIYPLSDEAIYELSRLEEVLEVHEMHGTFDLLLKIRANQYNEISMKEKYLQERILCHLQQQFCI